VDGLAVREEHYAKMMALFWNVYPAPNPAIPLHSLGDWLQNCADDPFLPNSHTIWTLPGVAEVLRVLEDGQSPEIDGSIVRFVSTYGVIDFALPSGIKSARDE
jgi:hypothetical protein